MVTIRIRSTIALDEIHPRWNKRCERETQMPKLIRRVLKASEVQSQGSFRLELEPKAAPQAGGSPHAPVPARIRIAENHPQFALVEVTCSCGKTTFVRCEYAESEGAPAGAAPS
jgi:hypothetical protein